MVQARLPSCCTGQAWLDLVRLYKQILHTSDTWRNEVSPVQQDMYPVSTAGLLTSEVQGLLHIPQISAHLYLSGNSFDIICIGVIRTKVI